MISKEYEDKYPKDKYGALEGCRCSFCEYIRRANSNLMRLSDKDNINIPKFIGKK